MTQLVRINWKIKSILSGLVTRRLYLKKKKMTRNGHFSRPAETDPYVLMMCPVYDRAECDNIITMISHLQLRRVFGANENLEVGSGLRSRVCQVPFSSPAWSLARETQVFTFSSSGTTSSPNSCHPCWRWVQGRVLNLLNTIVLVIKFAKLKIQHGTKLAKWCVKVLRTKYGRRLHVNSICFLSDLSWPESPNILILSTPRSS